MEEGCTSPGFLGILVAVFLGKVQSYVRFFSVELENEGLQSYVGLLGKVQG